MPRNVINKSISFDPRLFELAEARRESMRMERSEYIRSLIINDLTSGANAIPKKVLPENLRKDRTPPEVHEKARKKR